MFFVFTNWAWAVTVAARSEVWTVSAPSEAVILGSNPSQGMDVWCVYTFHSVFVLSCVYVRALRRADYSSKESYCLWKMITELNKRPVPWMSWKSHWKRRVIGLEVSEYTAELGILLWGLEQEIWAGGSFCHHKSKLKEVQPAGVDLRAFRCEIRYIGLRDFSLVLTKMKAYIICRVEELCWC
jgi:hypothetical protein